MEEGQIVKAAFLQADRKLISRPALLIKKMPGYGDWLVCGISKSTGLEIKGFDILLNKSHPDFKLSGLQHDGLIRLGFLYTISGNMIEGHVGSISKQTHKKLLNNLTNCLLK